MSGKQTQVSSEGIILKRGEFTPKQESMAGGGILLQCTGKVNSIEFHFAPEGTPEDTATRCAGPVIQTSGRLGGTSSSYIAMVGIDILEGLLSEDAWIRVIGPVHKTLRGSAKRGPEYKVF